MERCRRVAKHQARSPHLYLSLVPYAFIELEMQTRIASQIRLSSFSLIARHPVHPRSFHCVCESPVHILNLDESSKDTFRLSRVLRSLIISSRNPSHTPIFLSFLSTTFSSHSSLRCLQHSSSSCIVLTEMRPSWKNNISALSSAANIRKSTNVRLRQGYSSHSSLEPKSQGSKITFFPSHLIRSSAIIQLEERRLM
ncbi:hypothetical protein BDZ45DRAFT_94687 [Acephala macrosclerotiorum]|nr:hypothetical protein BDZ45DRAFT_94687 [Acephala macrosclerotiorum]